MKLRRTSCLLAIGLFVFAGGPAEGVTFHGRISNSLYSYETTETHTRLYQFARFTLEEPALRGFALNAFLRTATDLNETLNSDYRYRAYLLNAEAKNLFGRIDLVAGRQFLHSGTVLGGLDGVSARLKVSNRISVRAYGGVESHFQRAFKVYKADEALVTGGILELTRCLSSRIQLLYLQKSASDGIYWQLGGVNFSNRSALGARVRAEAHYDLKNERFHRLLADLRHGLGRKATVSVGFKQQYPQVYSNSFFTVFEVEAYRRYSLGCTYRISDDHYLSGRYQLLQFDTETANRAFATVGGLNGSIGFVFESGYAGDQVGFLADYAYSITPSLVASASVDYSRYKTEDVYEFEHELSNAVRLSYTLHKRWQMELEYQWLTDRFKSSDSRVLNHIHFSW